MRQSKQHKEEDDFHLAEFGDNRTMNNHDNRDGADQWLRVCSRLERDLGSSGFQSWFEHAEFLALDGDCATIGVPSEFVRHWLTSRYQDRLRLFWRLENPRVDTVRVIVVGKAKRGIQIRDAEGAANAPAETAPGSVSRNESKHGLSFPAANAALTTPLDPLCTFANFIVGPSNYLAHAAAQAVSLDQSAHVNPLYIYGSSGAGKSHLLQSVAWTMREKHPGHRILYLGVERFVCEFVRAIKQRDTMTFKDQLRGADLLILDDIQFMPKKGPTQEEFLHTLNDVLGRQRQVIVASDCAPSALDAVDERIRSRLSQGLIAQIGASDYELRRKIIEKRLEIIGGTFGPGVTVGDEVLDFLARKFVTDIRVLQGALQRLLQQSAIDKQPVCLARAKEMLSDLLQSNERILTIDDIQRCVARYYEVRLADILSPRRSQNIVRPRHVAMYLCKRLTTRSLPEIGRKFGGRDHSTVHHAVCKVEDLVQGDDPVVREIEALTQRLSEHDRRPS